MKRHELKGMSEATARVWQLTRTVNQSSTEKCNTPNEIVLGCGKYAKPIVKRFCVCGWFPPAPPKPFQEVIMIKQQNIKENARSRRDARRKAKQEAFAKANPMLVGRKYDVDTTPVEIECKPGYEPTPIKFVAQDAIWQRQEYKRQIERAAIVYSNEFGHKPLGNGMCLPDVALYAAGYRNAKPITAR